jgi:hypothetical protein
MTDVPNTETLYRHHCGWVGTERNMGADWCDDGDGDEIWSNWICPKCHAWEQNLKQYEKVITDAPGN